MLGGDTEFLSCIFHSPLSPCPTLIRINWASCLPCLTCPAWVLRNNCNCSDISSASFSSALGWFSLDLTHLSILHYLDILSSYTVSINYFFLLVGFVCVVWGVYLFPHWKPQLYFHICIVAIDNTLVLFLEK